MTITVPIEHELFFEEVLKEMSLSYEKKPLNNSALYPTKSGNGFLMYEVKTNETLAYVIGANVERKMNESNPN